MRAFLAAGAVALIVTGCGNNEQQQAQPTQSIQVRSAEQEQLHKLNDLNRAIALKRAIYDSGYACKRIDSSGYVGTYKSYIWTAKVGIAKNGQLTLRINDLEPVALIAESDTRFRPAGIKDTTLIFHADANGISHFILNREGKEIRANRKRPKAPRA